MSLADREAFRGCPGGVRMRQWGPVYGEATISSSWGRYPQRFRHQVETASLSTCEHYTIIAGNMVLNHHIHISLLRKLRAMSAILAHSPQSRLSNDKTVINDKGQRTYGDIGLKNQNKYHYIGVTDSSLFYDSTKENWIMMIVAHHVC